MACSLQGAGRGQNGVAFEAWIAADPAHLLADDEAELLWRESRLLSGMPTGQGRNLGKAPLLMRRSVQGTLAGVAVGVALGFVTIQMTVSAVLRPR